MVVARAVEPGTTPIPVQLDPELRKQVEWFLQRMMQSFSKRVGETVSLICGHALTISVLDALPGAMLSWFLNDDPLEMDPSRILYNKGNMDITDLTPRDTGVYICRVEWGPEKAKDNITVGMYSLVVTADNPTRFVFESDGMQLFCNSHPLGALLPAANRQWLYENTNRTTLAPTLAINASLDVVPRVDKSMAGVWTCRVDDLATQRNWTTAWFRLGVQDAPSFVARTYRVLADHVYVVIVVCSVLVVLLCVGFIFLVRLMKKKEDETDEEFLKSRNGWEEKFSKFGAGGKVKVNEAELPPKKPDKGEGKAATDVSTVGDTEGKEDTANLLDEGEQSSEGEDVTVVKNNEGKDFDFGDSEANIGGKEADGEREANIRDRDINVGDGGEDGGDESDSNKSATLSRRKVGKRKNKVRWQSRYTRRNNVLTDNGENISNIQRHAISGGPMAIRLSEKKEYRKRVDGKRKKLKGKVIYPEVSKDSALNWLLQNSPQLRKFKSIFQDTSNKMSVAAQCRLVEPARLRQVSLDTHRPSTDIDDSATSSNTQAYLWKMPEFSPSDVRNWLSRGRERMSGWTVKPTSRGHSDIRYTVLPQDDDDDFF